MKVPIGEGRLIGIRDILVADSDPRLFRFRDEPKDWYYWTGTQRITPMIRQHNDLPYILPYIEAYQHHMKSRKNIVTREMTLEDYAIYAVYKIYGGPPNSGFKATQIHKLVMHELERGDT